jgi:hypothetical protein
VSCGFIKTYRVDCIQDSSLDTPREGYGTKFAQQFSYQSAINQRYELFARMPAFKAAKRQNCHDMTADLSERRWPASNVRLLPKARSFGLNKRRAARARQWKWIDGELDQPATNLAARWLADQKEPDRGASLSTARSTPKKISGQRWSSWHVNCVMIKAALR